MKIHELAVLGTTMIDKCFQFDWHKFPSVEFEWTNVACQSDRAHKLYAQEQSLEDFIVPLVAHTAYTSLIVEARSGNLNWFCFTLCYESVGLWIRNSLHLRILEVINFHSISSFILSLSFVPDSQNCHNENNKISIRITITIIA